MNHDKKNKTNTIILQKKGSKRLQKLYFSRRKKFVQTLLSLFFETKKEILKKRYKNTHKRHKVFTK
jgi:hypothetical protein